MWRHRADGIGDTRMGEHEGVASPLPGRDRDGVSRSGEREDRVVEAVETSDGRHASVKWIERAVKCRFR